MRSAFASRSTIKGRGMVETFYETVKDWKGSNVEGDLVVGLKKRLKTTFENSFSLECKNRVYRALDRLSLEPLCDWNSIKLIAEKAGNPESDDTNMQMDDLCTNGPVSESKNDSNFEELELQMMEINGKLDKLFDSVESLRTLLLPKKQAGKGDLSSKQQSSLVVNVEN
eukprot:TRINITY_DN450_c0_g1_i1.p1 TRINITY_DN450_c0_g1~~TRINITY_DN450_c0_g1_i1.p1  ORF type:complete len:169 (-),score=36.38 TRINITY_DN450_c0_g1_i1:92-598(-)